MAIALQGTPTVYESASATSVVIPFPSGIVAGELLIAQVTESAATASTTNPGGWTLAKAQNGPTSAPSTAVWYRVADGTETGSVTFATNATAGRVTGTMERWSGVDTTTPMDAAAVSANSPVATTFQMPSITTVTANAVLVHAISLNASSSADIDTLAGTTKVTGSTGTGRRQGVFYETLAAAGASGTRTWTENPTTTTLQWAGVTLALRPAAVAGNPSPVGIATAEAFGTTTATVMPPPSLVQRIVGIPASPATNGVVQVKVSNCTSARLMVSTDAAGTLGVVYGPPVTPSANGDARLTVSGLVANTRYYYRVEMTNGGTVLLDTAATIGRLKTAPSGAGSFAFDFGSCTNATDSTSMSAIAARADDMFMHLGDLYYADASGTGLQNFRDKMNAKITVANHAAVFATMNTTYTPSDHDGMNNNSAAGSDATAWTNWNTAVAELFPMSSTYYAWTWGRVRFIQLDTRSFKSAPANTDDAAKTALGATQKQWLKDQITNMTEAVAVIVQDGPWIGAAVAGDDGWFGYTTERTELANFFTASGKNVAMLAGDMHAVGADNGTNAPGGITVWHGAPLNNAASQKGGPYSAGIYPASGTAVVEQYSRVVVTDTGGSTIQMDFTGYSSDNTSRITMAKTFSAPTTVTALPSGVGSGEAFGTPAASGLLTASPAGIGSDEAFGTPAMSGGLTVSPSGIATAEALGAAAAVLVLAVAPLGIGSGEAFGVPVAGGSVTVSPASVTSAEAFGTATAVVGSAISPSGIPSGEAFGVPAMSGNLAASPSGIGSLELFGTPSASLSWIAAPAGIGSGEAFGVPLALAPLTAAPAGIGSGELFGTPSVGAVIPAAPVGIPSGEAFGTVTAGGVLLVGPVGIASGQALGVPAASTAVYVLAVGVGSGESFGLPTVFGSARDITLAAKALVSRFAAALLPDRFIPESLEARWAAERLEGEAMQKEILTSAGAAEYVGGTVSETSGKDISGATFKMSLGSSTQPGPWVDPSVSSPGAGNSQRVLKLLVSSTTPKGRYYVWARISDSPEVAPVKFPQEIVVR